MKKIFMFIFCWGILSCFGWFVLWGIKEGLLSLGNDSILFLAIFISFLFMSIDNFWNYFK